MSILDEVEQLKKTITKFNNSQVFKRLKCTTMTESYYRERKILDDKLQALMKSQEYKDAIIEKKARAKRNRSQFIKIRIKTNKKMRAALFLQRQRDTKAGYTYDKIWNNRRPDKVHKLKLQAKELSELAKLTEKK